MTLYRLLKTEKAVDSFRPSPFKQHYQEADLEDWLESNPAVLVSEEPLLVIGRQVNTEVGIIDLLTVDAQGAIGVVELKCGNSPRDTIAQVLEYTAWASQQNPKAVRRIADDYLRKKQEASLEAVRSKQFPTKLPELDPSKRHRIFVIVERDDERLTSVATYLRESGIDITLIAYSYYRSDTGDEFLDIKRIVGEDSSHERSSFSVPVYPTEKELLDLWDEKTRESYQVFKEHLTEAGLDYHMRKTQVSFRREGLFICGFQGSEGKFTLWIRFDTLQSLFDFESVAQEIEKEFESPETKARHSPTWLLITCPSRKDWAMKAATVVVDKIVQKVK